MGIAISDLGNVRLAGVYFRRLNTKLSKIPKLENASLKRLEAPRPSTIPFVGIELVLGAWLEGTCARSHRV